MAFPDCYHLIIKIGKGELLPRNSVLIKYFPENDRRAWILYDVNICETLSEEDLIFYYKGFKRLEKELNWNLGSTAPSLKVLEHIKLKGISHENI